MKKIAAKFKEPESYKRKKIFLGKSFMAGLDPTGIRTFDIAQKVKRHKAHRTTGVAGGVVGGMTLIPSTIGGFSGASKGFIKGKGLGGKILSALMGFGSGAVKPYKQLYHGLSASKGLKAMYGAGKLNKKTISHVGKLMDVDDLKNINPRALKLMKGRVKGSPIIKEIKRHIDDKVTQVGTGFAASGVIGGGSSYLQYGQGKKIGDIEIGLRDKLQKKSGLNKIYYRTFEKELRTLK